jgi:hypothetical protein
MLIFPKRVIKGLYRAAEGEIARMKNRFQQADISPRDLSDSFARKALTPTQIAEHFRNRNEPRFFINSSDREEFTRAFRNRFPAATRTVVADADRICEHRFNMLGAKDVKLGTPLDWHTDFKSGIRWNPRTYHKLIEPMRSPPGADIKVPWELSRFQHLPTLGMAYWCTDDEKYAREFKAEVGHWIEENPPGFGVNWTCAMDVAIRIANWLWGWYLFKDSLTVDDQFARRFLRSVIDHGKHIRNNPEIVRFEGKRFTTNHYVADLAGLVYLGVMFPELRDAGEWLAAGMSGLEEQINAQVHDDGADFESSIPYHRLVLELFIYPALLCRLNGIAFSEDYWNRLEKMIEFVAAYTKPDGEAPQIGDVDDGRLHILADYSAWNRRDHTYLVALGNELLARSDLHDGRGKAGEEAYWLTGTLKRENLLPVREGRRKTAAASSSTAFEDSGFYIMRANDDYMIVSTGKVGTNGLGNHKHNDVFSFELCAQGTTFIVDPGTYLYTPDPVARNLFRSTAYHNTVQVDGEEVNAFDPRRLFSMRESASPRVKAWESDSRHDYLDAEHHGFCRLPDPIIHRRHVCFDKGNVLWLIKDELVRKRQDEHATDAEHTFSQYFHFAPMTVRFLDMPFDVPEVACRVIEQRFGLDPGDYNFTFAVEADSGDGPALMLVPVLTARLEREMAVGWVSPSYGVRQQTPIVRFEKKGGTAEFLTLLFSRSERGNTK